MEYTTDYPRLCPQRQAAIKLTAEIINELPDEYAADEEGPSMWVYDHGGYCGGHRCLKEEQDDEDLKLDAEMAAFDFMDKEYPEWTDRDAIAGRFITLAVQQRRFFLGMDDVDKGRLLAQAIRQVNSGYRPRPRVMRLI